MPIVKGASYSATIQTPLPPENYSAMRVTFAQGGQVLAAKDKPDLLLQNGLVIVQLSQENTLGFMAGAPALMQIRCYRSEYDAPGSACWPIPVQASNEEEVLP